MSALRIQSLHAGPVLFSGVAALKLLQSEISILHSNHKNVLQSLQKLHKNTPECFIMFMGGSLGATAIVHMKQLSLYGMICRLPENILNRIAAHKLYTEPDNSSSWFVEIRHLCQQYALPTPLFLLAHPPPKQTFKSLVKKKNVDYWQKKYRTEALKPSLQYFKPQFMSLLRPHPLWTTCQSNSFEVNKSIAVARLLSGQYRSDWHCRHWSRTNKEGFCLLCPDKNIPGNIETSSLTARHLTTREAFFSSFGANILRSLHIYSILCRQFGPPLPINLFNLFSELESFLATVKQIKTKQ